MKTFVCVVVLAIVGHASALPVGLSPITTSGTIVRSDLGLPSLIRSDLGISSGLPLATIPASTINLSSGLPAAVSIQSAAASPIALSGLSPITLSAQAPTLNLASGLPAAVSLRSAAAPIALSGLSPITLGAQAPIGSILPLNGSPIISTNSGILRSVPLTGPIISQGSINQIW
ncbi:uncharacterized protein LOC129772833 [Toxorhynchites rutilus septentrionalis]|uniref:uncharacterized protein LOC129772833 n=1 Tax=Toxorhynchites rutilus septentrionalis TaxID=329112 RepID=UPI0024790E8F|nr:uncharacterized protein LOC129772833 [Toxorhynchites rutilus septentrionalis]